MNYELQGVPDFDEGTPSIDGFLLTKQIALLVKGAIDKGLSHIGKGLDRSPEYNEMSDKTRDFINEITYQLLIEQFALIFKSSVQLDQGARYHAHTCAIKEIEGCSSLVKMINKLSEEDIRGALIAKTKKDAISMLLELLQSDDSENVTPEMPINWESLSIKNPFKTNTE